MKRKAFPFIIPLLVAFSLIPAFAEMKTFVKEYTYQASEFDSKATCRTLALDQVKRLLLEELGTYIESVTEIKNYQLTKDKVTMFAAGFVQTQIIEEKWDGKSYRVKVEMAADPSEITKSIYELREKSQLSRELIEARKKTDEALKEIEQLKKIQKTTKSGREKLEHQKKYEEEVKIVDEYELWKKDLETLSKGAVAYDKGNYDEAIYLAKIIIANQKSPHICGAYTLLGDAYRNKSMYNEAIDALNMPPKLCPTSFFVPFAHQLLGRTFTEMKLYEKAIAEFRISLTLLYDDKKRWENQSPSQYFQLEDLQRTRDEVDESIAENHFRLFGVYLENAGMSVWGSKPGTSPKDMVEIPEEARPEATKAFAEWDKALALKPNSMKHLRLAHEIGWGKFREIIAWCDKLIKLNPNNGEVYYIRGANYLRLENYQQAIKDLSQAIDLNPNAANYYERRGSAYMLLGDLCSDAFKDHAFKDFDKAIELDPIFAQAYFGRGICGHNRQQAENDLKISARLGHGGAQLALREKGIKW